MNLQNNFTRLDKNLKEVLEKWDKKYFLSYQDAWMDLPEKQGLYKEREGYVLHQVY